MRKRVFILPIFVIGLNIVLILGSLGLGYMGLKAAYHAIEASGIPVFVVQKPLD